MEQYQKPVMKIIELEELDILTHSCECPAGCTTTIGEGSNAKTTQLGISGKDAWLTHMKNNHQDYITTHLDWEKYWDDHAKDWPGSPDYKEPAK